MPHSQPRLLELVPSDSLPRFPLDDESLPTFPMDDEDDMARTLEVRPRQPTSPDALCEIGVRASDVSSRPVWNIRAAWPARQPMKTVSVRRHPTLRFALPIAASAVAFAITLALAFLFRGTLESAFSALLF